MNRSKASVLLVFMAAGIACAGAEPRTFELLSSEEAAAWNAPESAPQAHYNERDLVTSGVPNCHVIPTGKASPHDPQIQIVSPQLDKPLAAPLDINLKFVSGGASIKPETFKVCYVGFLVMDLTKRVTDHVAVSAEGIHVTGAELPKGHHHLVMMIADRAGAIGSRDAVFDIE
ncbi:MAG TPA: hypothetical protein VGI93_07950 [Steroidobacteraceae bacterium]|jgi:hypothetical protein